MARAKMSERCHCDSSSAFPPSSTSVAEAAEDSSDLEDSWAGEDVNLDASPDESGKKIRQKHRLHHHHLVSKPIFSTSLPQSVRAIRTTKMSPVNPILACPTLTLTIPSSSSSSNNNSNSSHPRHFPSNTTLSWRRLSWRRRRRRNITGWPRRAPSAIRGMPQSKRRHKARTRGFLLRQP